MQTELVFLTNHTTLRWEDNIKMDIQEVKQVIEGTIKGEIEVTRR
jgi:hypothetical protein